ncbi:MAG: efflux RND transporter periplasmic adaptor subunit [Byssovorax sp.]
MITQPPLPIAPTVPAPSPARSRRVLIGLGAAALLLAAGVLGLRLTRGGPGPAALPPPDVPHLDGKAIVFSKAFIERSGVKTTAVREAPLTPVVKVTGTVTYDPEYQAAVGTRIQGLVRKLSRIEGDSVKEGDLLAEIESAELGQAQASVSMVAAQKRAAELNAARERELSARKLSTAREAEVAEATLAEHQALLSAAQQKVVALSGSTPGRFGVYALRAPLTGTVVERTISAGQSVESHLVAFRVADLDHLWIELSVFERSVAAIRKGDVVEVRSPSHPDEVITGTVAYVGEEIDRITRSAAVRVKVDNHARKLRPGQSVTATIRASGRTKSGLLLPKSAVIFVDGKPTVFLTEGEGRVIPTPVTLGASDGEDLEITGGLALGQVVVSEGAFALKSELFR